MALIRILLADDSDDFRKAVRYYLEQIPDFFVVGEARNGEELIELANNNPSDVALVDIRMPQMDGIIATRKLMRSHHPHLRIIAVSMHNELENLTAMIEAGAMGYVGKDDLFPHLEKAIRAVNANNYYYGKKDFKPLKH